MLEEWIFHAELETTETNSRRHISTRSALEKEQPNRYESELNLTEMWHYANDMMITCEFVYAKDISHKFIIQYGKKYIYFPLSLPHVKASVEFFHTF